MSPGGHLNGKGEDVLTRQKRERSMPAFILWAMAVPVAAFLGGGAYLIVRLH
jgi:hypothetical protein